MEHCRNDVGPRLCPCEHVHQALERTDEELQKATISPRPGVAGVAFQLVKTHAVLVINQRRGVNDYADGTRRGTLR